MLQQSKSEHSSLAVLGIPIHTLTMQETIAWCKQRIAARAAALLVTANAEIVMLGQQDAEFRQILCTADLVIPDGAGIVWAGRHLGQPVPERVAGCDLVANLFAEAAVEGWSVFLLGAAPGVAATVANNMQQTHPALRIAGVRDGYFRSDEEAGLIEEIRQAKPDILLAALGVPRQEKWLYRFKNQLGVPLLIGVGGTFDVMAGTVERAPGWMQRNSLEWLFRLYKQPQRFLRMLALPAFVWRVLTAKKY